MRSCPLVRTTRCGSDEMDQAPSGIPRFQCIAKYLRSLFTTDNPEYETHSKDRYLIPGLPVIDQGPHCATCRTVFTTYVSRSTPWPGLSLATEQVTLALLLADSISGLKIAHQRDHEARKGGRLKRSLAELKQNHDSSQTS